MKNSKLNRVLVMLAGMVAIPVLGAQVTYLVTDLGTLGGSTATASAINTNSQVTGYSSKATGGFDAYLFSSHTMLDLGNLGGVSVGNALNNLGHVAGYSSTSGTTTTNHPFLFRNGGLLDLGLPIAFNTGSANGVNDIDQVVGQFVSGTRRSSVSHAFLWQNGGFTLLPTLGGINAIANAINNAGQIVGWSSTSAGFTHATLWQGGGVFDLGTLPGGGGSQAFAINNNHQAAGNASDPTSGNTHAALFQNGAATDLGVPFGFASSTANAINDQGVAVGSATVGSYRGIAHAFIAQNGNNIDLNRLIPGNSGSWVLISASGINDVGIIVGSGTTNGVHHAFLLTPTTAATVPAAPINLTQSSGNRVVNLNWMPSFGVTAYNVKRGTSSTGPFSTIATVNGTSFTDTTVVDCTLYDYTISALNSAGESPNSSVVGADPQSVPPAPTDLTATQNTQANLFDGSAIVLSWQFSDVNCSTDILVERSTDGVNFQPAFTVGPNQGSIVDGFLNSGTRYYYLLRAESTGGDSGPSNIASAVAP